jgi:hypothetical protein
MKKFKEFKKFEHVVQNSKYDIGAQNQIKKTKTRSPSLTLGAQHTIWQGNSKI